MSAWKKLCASGDIGENALVELDIDGVAVVVTRTGDECFVYPLRCPHMEEPLSTGFCDGATVTCSFHLWQRDMRTGESTGNAEVDLLKYPVKVEGGVLYADFAEILTYED
jgi:nitrite reductase/ring-hydroxylating ferredoxin subunit